MKKLLSLLAAALLLSATPALAISQAGVPPVPMEEGVLHPALGGCAWVYLMPGQTCSVDEMGRIVISGTETAAESDDDIAAEVDLCHYGIGKGCVLKEVEPTFEWDDLGMGKRWQELELIGAQ